MTTIVLVRHGEVEGITPPRFRGRMELPLTERGCRQAQLTAERVKAVWPTLAGVYSSPMGRAVATASAISAPHGLTPEALSDFDDIDYGAWQGLTVEEVRAGWPDALEAWYKTPQLARVPGGEALPDVAARLWRALSGILERHPDKGAVVGLVGHDSLNRVLLGQLLGLPLSAYWTLVQEPAAINVVEIVSGRVRVERINETAHLAGL